MIRATIRLPLKSFALDVEFTLEAPVTALFGVSGAGKTSVLEVLAGLRDEGLEGEIAIDGQSIFSSSKRILVSPEKRRFGYVPQDILLFPHMKVMQNILYGNKEEGGEFLDQVMDILELRSLLTRDPAVLSGGERQRVCLARALVTRPRLLLLDEPLAALDVGLKSRIFPYLRRVYDAFHVPMIYVTHDVTDVMTFCEEAVVLDRGKVISQGTPKQVLSRRPVIQRFFGETLENVFEGTIEAHRPAKGATHVRIMNGPELRIPYHKDYPPEANRIRVGIAAEDILVSVEAPRGISARNILKGKIQNIEYFETFILLRILAEAPFLVRLTPDAADHLSLQEGQEVHVIIKSHSIHRLD
jgi:molybdate transport system ATP-binding protein